MTKPVTHHPWKQPEEAYARLASRCNRNKVLVAEKIIEALEAEDEVLELIKHKGFLTTEVD